MTRPNPPNNRILAAIVIGIAGAGVTWSAMASRTQDDRTVAAELMARYTAGSAGAPAASHALGQTREALRRADQARAAGDEANARRLEGLAREWAEMAQDVARAAVAEQRADQSQRAAASASQGIRKSQALLETLVARRARAQAELQEIHTASSAAIPTAALSAARMRPSQAPAASSVTSPGGER